MAIEWPDGVNQFVSLPEWREGFKERSVASPTDLGPPKRRVRYTAAPTPVTFAFLFTNAEFTTFKAWFDQDLAAGALTFNFPNPRTNVVTEYQIRDFPTPARARGYDSYIVVLQLDEVP